MLDKGVKLLRGTCLCFWRSSHEQQMKTSICGVFTTFIWRSYIVKPPWKKRMILLFSAPTSRDGNSLGTWWTSFSSPDLPVPLCNVNGYLGWKVLFSACPFYPVFFLYAYMVVMIDAFLVRADNKAFFCLSWSKQSLDSSKSSSRSYQTEFPLSCQSFYKPHCVLKVFSGATSFFHSAS